VTTKEEPDYPLNLTIIGQELDSAQALQGVVVSDPLYLITLGWTTRLLDTPKFDTFYMVFKKAFENKILLDRLRDFVVVPSSAGGNSSFELHSQSMEERATLDRYHHFHGRTRTRTNTNPNDTEANAAGRSGNARALRKTSKY